MRCRYALRHSQSHRAELDLVSSIVSAWWGKERDMGSSVFGAGVWGPVNRRWHGKVLADALCGRVPLPAPHLGDFLRGIGEPVNRFGEKRVAEMEGGRGH